MAGTLRREAVHRAHLHRRGEDAPRAGRLGADDVLLPQLGVLEPVPGRVPRGHRHRHRAAHQRARHLPRAEEPAQRRALRAREPARQRRRGQDRHHAPEPGAVAGAAAAAGAGRRAAAAQRQAARQQGRAGETLRRDAPLAGHEPHLQRQAEPEEGAGGPQCAPGSGAAQHLHHAEAVSGVQPGQHQRGVPAEDHGRRGAGRHAALGLLQRPPRVARQESGEQTGAETEADLAGGMGPARRLVGSQLATVRHGDAGRQGPGECGRTAARRGRGVRRPAAPRESLRALAGHATGAL